MTTTQPVSTLPRTALVDELVALFPALRRRFQAGIPADLETELARVTPHQLESLHLIAHASRVSPDGSTTMNEVARAQGCALSSATALVDRLLRSGLVERVDDPDDRRVVRVALTQRGDDLTRRFGIAKRAMAMNAVSELSDAELDTLVRLLGKAAAAAPDAKEVIE